MADRLTKEQRSINMSRIKGKDTSVEIYIRKFLFKEGYRYRKNSSSVIGHPDIWLRKYNTAIFVNGCFWHRHFGCKFAYTPKTRIDYWETKFMQNIERDSKIQKQLVEKGIKCIVIWECTVKKMMKDEDFQDDRLNQIIRFFNSEKKYLEL